LGHIVNFFIGSFGYITAVEFKDILTFLAGIMAGGLIMIILISRFFYRVQKVETLGKAISVRFREKDGVHYFTRMTNFYQAMEFILVITLLPFTVKEEYLLENRKRTVALAHFMMTLTVFITMCGIWMIFNPLVTTSQATLARKTAISEIQHK
jgi:hypothetical protein